MFDMGGGAAGGGAASGGGGGGGGGGMFDFISGGVASMSNSFNWIGYLDYLDRTRIEGQNQSQYNSIYGTGGGSNTTAIVVGGLIFLTLLLLVGAAIYAKKNT